MFVSEEKFLYKQTDVMEKVKSLYEKLFRNSDSGLVAIDLQSIIKSSDIPN